MKKLLFSTFSVFSALAIIADNGNGWNLAFKPEKVFIENRGQFGPINNNEVVFAADQDRTKIYFSTKGITYSFFKVMPKNEEEESEREKEMKKEASAVYNTLEDWQAKEREERKLDIRRDFVSVIWENSNPDVKIEAQDEVHDYFNYGSIAGSGQPGISNVKAFKKIVYKNLYPNIDLEYVFHSQDGIKYSLILHPGADISKVRMKYSDGEKVSLRNNGDIHIKTIFGDIIDHEPVTFYADNTSHIIPSKFIREGNVVSFQLEGFDNTKEIIVDPWTQTPTLPNSNGVWECEKDASGNVYIIGGDVPLKLLKYNSSGVLQWTFVTAYDTSGGGDWLGTMATDKNGNSYVTNGSTAALTKVNTSGAQVYAVTGGSVDEYWNIAFNCDQTKLIVGGTRLNAFPTVKGYGTIFDINTATGAVTATTNVGYSTPGAFGISNPDEVRSITSSKNARYYYLTLDSMGCVDQNFSACPGNSSLFKIDDAFKFAYKCENYRPNNGNAGIMAIRANGNFVYTHNGTTIQKRSLSTGAVITSATIPGGASTASFGYNSVSNSGIDIDSCGNVYVGSTNAVVKYDANLVQLASSATAFKVYDVCVSYGGNVIATGATGTNSSTTRTGYVESFNMSSCNPQQLVCCDANFCAAGPFCTTSSNYTLSAVTPGGTWSGTGVNSSGVFSPATAGSGTFTIVYTLACGSSSVDIVVNPCVTLNVCNAGSTLQVSGGTPSYTWSVYSSGGSSPITTQAQCTACNSSYTWFFGQCLNGATPVTTCTTAASWTQVGTGSVIPTPTTTPIKVVDAAGNSYTITSVASLPTCTTSCTTPTLSIASQTNVSCHGGNNGSATISVTPAGTYTYNWQPGGGTSATQGGLTAGTYSVAAINGTCTGTISVVITEPAVLTATASQTGSVTCNGGANGSATVAISGGTTSYSVNWSGGGGSGTSATGLSATNYTATVTDAHSCVATSTVTIMQPPPINVSFPSMTPASCGGSNGSVTASATGGTGAMTYTWNTSATGATLSNVPGGNYTVNVTDANNCPATGTVTVTSTGGPTVTAVETASVTCAGLSNGSASVTITGGTPTYTVNWSNGTSGVNGSGLPAGTATATVTDANNCIATATVTIDQPTPLAITFTNNSPSSCGGNTGSVTAVGSGGTGTITYTWNTGASGATLGSVPAGSYTVTATDANSCTYNSSVNISTSSGPTITPVATASVACNGGTTGAASVSISGGTPGYTVTWSGGGSGTTNTGIPAGLYTVTVTDAASCIISDTVRISQPPALTVTASGSPAGCTNPVGTATANATGGTGSVTYTWSDSQTGATANGLAGGTYTVVSVDGNGCKDSTTVTIGVTASPSVTASGSPTGCTNSIGTATASASGGTGSVTYAWSDSQAGATATGLGSGTYTVVATDANGCKDSATVTISPTTPPTLIVTGNATGCNNSVGTATVTPNGGTGTITYTWSPSGGNAATASGLSNQVYTVTATDANGCTNTATISIGVTASPTLTIDSTKDVRCNGQANGEAYAHSNGGTPGYTYSWSNSGTGTSQTNLSQGSYSVVVTDANGCKDTANFAITQPAVLSHTVSAVTDENCNLSNGAATITESGGTTSYGYQWSSGQTSATVTNFPAGSYTVIVTDAKGCKDSASVTIGNIPGPTATAAQTTSVTCNAGANGSATVTASGGTTGYTYTWSNGATGVKDSNLVAGTYTVITTDGAGCTFAATVTIAQPTAVTVTATSTTVSCSGGNNGTATAVAGGGFTPYTITWSNAQTGTTATGLTAGVYTVNVTDGNGCPANTTITVVENPPVDTLTITGEICINDPTVLLTAPAISSGSTHQWSLGGNAIAGATGYTYSGNSATASNYSVIWSYAGCRYNTSSVAVTFMADLGGLPTTNVFTPNGDNINDEYMPFSTVGVSGSAGAVNQMLGGMIEDYELSIYDRWGILLFKTTTVTDTWNGKTSSGKDCTAGTYYWIAKYKAKCSKNTGIQNIKGFVELIK
ncbi:MAG: DUF7948 domain-containing protein [Bacteroidia bacterium]